MRLLEKEKLFGCYVASKLSTNSPSFKENRFEGISMLEATYCTYDTRLEKILRSFRFEDSEAVEMVSKNPDLASFLDELLDTTASFNYTFSAKVRTSDLIADGGHKIFVRYSAVRMENFSMYMTNIQEDYTSRNRYLYKIMMRKLFVHTKRTRTSIILDEVI